MRQYARVGFLALAALLASAAAPATEYVNDPAWGWGTGRMIEDAFANTGDQNYVGRSVAKLDNGDVVVAGTVPHSAGFGAIGLVRYAANGTSGRVAWTNPGPYGTFSNQYVVFPGQSLWRIASVRKVIVHEGLIFVLAETYVGSESDASVFVFGTDGSFKDAYLVDTASNDANGRTVWSGGIAAYTTGAVSPFTHHLVYAGRKKTGLGTIERITYRRYTFTTAGVMTPATNLIHPGITECGSSTHCTGFDIAVGGSTAIGGTPRVYITGSRHLQCPVGCSGAPEGWWAFAAQINPTTGNSSGMGFRSMTGGDDSTSRSRGRAIAVHPRNGITGTQDDIYVLAERERNCRWGMVISAYRANAPTTWDKVIGGSDATGLTCNSQVEFGLRRVVPVALVLQDGRLAAAGYGEGKNVVFCPPSSSCEDNVDGFIAILDAANGNLISPATTSGNPEPKYYPFTDAAGARIRHSRFYGVVGAGDGRFTVAGDTRVPENTSPASHIGKLRYASLRVLESTGGGGGLPFSDGFEGDGGQPPQPAQFRGTNIAGMTVAHYTCTQPGGPVPGTDFHTADTRLVDYYASKNMKALRLKVTWECLQPVLNGAVPAAGANYQSYFDSMKTLVDYATNTKQMHVVITPWQSDSQSPYAGLCGACYKNVVIGSSAAVTNAHFADFWAKMANHFKNNPRVGFGLVNEPNNMSTMQWFATAQAAITAIRNTGATQQTIYVPGNGWTGASTWTSSDYDTASPKRSNAYGWLNARGVGLPLLDPQNKLVVEVHTYVDSTQGGLGDDITSATAARNQVNATVNWARANGLKVYLGEIGIFHGTAGAPQAWADFVSYAGTNTDTLMGFTWWAGGYPGWWNVLNAPYFSITPTNAANYTGDNANMTMIQGAFQ